MRHAVQRVSPGARRCVTCVNIYARHKEKKKLFASPTISILRDFSFWREEKYAHTHQAQLDVAVDNLLRQEEVFVEIL